MKYTVEGVEYATHALALAAATHISTQQARPVKIETGDSTLGDSVVAEWVGATATTTPANELLEPVDRTERLAKRVAPVDGAPSVPE
jgi:hypothetical protein